MEKKNIVDALPYVLRLVAGKVRRRPGHKYEVWENGEWVYDGVRLHQLVAASAQLLPPGPEWDRVRRQLCGYGSSFYQVFLILAGLGHRDQDGVFRADPLE